MLMEFDLNIHLSPSLGLSIEKELAVVTPEVNNYRK